MFRPWFAKLSAVRMSLAARRGHARRLRLESLESRDVPSVPVGPEFLVNTTAPEIQGHSDPSVAVDPAGNFVVTWVSYQQDGSGLGIYAQRYGSDGLPQGGEFLVNTTVLRHQIEPAVAVDADGNFTIAWNSQYQDGSGFGIYAQRYAADGTPLGSEFLVNTFTTSHQSVPMVAADAAGNFVVAWQSYGQDGSQWGIYAQRYDADGTPQGSDFRVNTFTAGLQQNPSVAMSPAGDFVIAWESVNQGQPGASVYAQRYAANGTPQGGEFPVDTYPFGAQFDPTVALDAAGNFIIAWNSYTQDGSGYGVYAQRFATNGTPQGNEFRVNTTVTSNQARPTVAADATGNFVVAWDSINSVQDGSGFGVYAQEYAADGTPRGSEFQVNTATAGGQQSPSVAIGPAGNFVVAWQASGIYAQRYGSIAPTDLTLSKTAIAENAGKNAVVGTLSPTDPDAFDQFTFALVPGIGSDDNATFKLDENKLRANSSFDFETRSSYSVRIRVTDAGGLTFEKPFTITVTDVNDRPILSSILTPITYTENATLILSMASTVADVDSANFDTGQLTVILTANAEVNDRLSIRHQGFAAGQIGISGSTVTFGSVPIGTFTGGVGPPALVVTFNTNATLARVQAVLRNLTYQLIHDNPTTLTRTVRYTLTDGDGGTSTAVTQTVNIVPVNDRPLLGDVATPITYTENATLLLAPAGIASDLDSPNLNSGMLTVTLSKNAVANDRLAIRNQGTAAGQIGVSGNTVTFSGTAIGTFAGGVGTDSLVVTFNASATPAVAQAVLRNVTYQLHNDNPTVLTRTIRFTLTDGDGGTSAAVNQTVTIAPVNDAPTLVGIATPITYIENATLLLAPAGSAADVDSVNFDTGKLSVTLTANASTNDRLSIRHQGFAAGHIGVSGTTVSFSSVPIGTFAGGVGTTPLVITFNVNATPGRVQAVLRNIRYQLLFDNPTILTRNVRYTLSDGDGGSSSAVNQTVTIVPVNDAPTLGGISGPKTYNALAAPLVLAPTGTVTDLDSQNFDGGKLTIRLIGNGVASDRLAIRHQGFAAGQIGVSGTNITFGSVVIGTFTGGAAVASPLVVTFNANATVARVQAVLRNVTYTNVSATPATAPRTVRFALTDGDGGSIAAVDQVVNVSVP